MIHERYYLMILIMIHLMISPRNDRFILIFKGYLNRLIYIYNIYIYIYLFIYDFPLIIDDYLIDIHLFLFEKKYLLNFFLRILSIIELENIYLNF